MKNFDKIRWVDLKKKLSNIFFSVLDSINWKQRQSFRNFSKDKLFCTEFDTRSEEKNSHEIILQNIVNRGVVKNDNWVFK